MARTWLQIPVELVSGRGASLDPPPGRAMIVGPSHTFAQLADATNAAFARWDLSHLHEFELADGRRIGFPSDDHAPDLEWEDHARLKVAKELRPGDEFEFVFDFGDDWRHRCRILDEKVDPADASARSPIARCRSGAGVDPRSIRARVARRVGRPYPQPSIRRQVTTQPKSRNAWWSSGRRS